MAFFFFRRRPAPNIAFVCQAGRLEAMAVLLAASLRRFHPEARLWGAVPGSLPHPTARLLEGLSVRLSPIENPVDPDYPIAQKIAALTLLPEGEPGLLLDSDILCARPLPPIPVGPFHAKPAELVTFGGEERWRELYQLFKLPFPERRVVAPLPESLMAPYFNSGVVATDQPGALAEAWTLAFRRLLDAGVREPKPFLDQVALSLV